MLLNAFSDDTRLYLVTRSADGARQIKTTPPEYSCFLRARDVPQPLLDQLRSSRRVKRLAEEGDYLRVVWRDRWSRFEACKPKGEFDKAGVEVLEGDVDPTRRYLTDHPEVEIAKPRRCYVDFECDSRFSAEETRGRARMLAWSVVDELPPAPGDRVVELDLQKAAPHAAGEEGWNLRDAIERIRGAVQMNAPPEVTRKVVRVAVSAVLVEDSDEAERALVEAFWRAIAGYDQVVAWAGDFFDFPYLQARTEHLRVRVDPREWLWLDQQPWYRVRDTDAGGADKQSQKLDDVARQKAGVGKLDGVSGKDAWDLWLADPTKLLRYCERDSALCAVIEAATGYIDILNDLAQLSACFPDSNGRKAKIGRNFYGVQPTSQVEGFLMRLGAARGHRFRSHWYDPDLKKKREEYAGGHVEDASVGFHEDVHVCDFARLYPNAIMTFNLSPETYRGKVPERPTYGTTSSAPPPPDGCAVVPGTRAVFAQEPRGVLPLALERLLELRAECGRAKKTNAPDSREWQDADRKDQALKTAINAYYGVVGSPYSRFFLREVAESTTLIGQWLLGATLRAATDRGYVTRGGDTDSSFVAGPSEAEFREFVAWCNADLYPPMVRGQGAARCTIALEFEKTFSRMVITGKKRYAGLVVSYKGVKGVKLVVRGLEARRGDWPRLSARFQEAVLDLAVVRGVREPAPFVELVSAVREIVLPKTEIYAGRPRDCSTPLRADEVSRWQRLVKPLDEYVQRKKDDGEDAAQGVHVTVARLLKSRGQQIGKGSKIAYVVTDGAQSPAKAIPVEDYAGELDRYYLWEQLVYPPAMRVLQAAIPGEDWEQYLKARPSKRQMGDPRQLKLF